MKNNEQINNYIILLKKHMFVLKIYYNHKFDQLIGQCIPFSQQICVHNDGLFLQPLQLLYLSSPFLFV
jgi:hypothetical protein